MIRRFRSLPLRSRLALLVAAAVAFGVAAVSVSCWFIVQGKLYEQVDNDLKSSSVPVRPGGLANVLAECRTTPSPQEDRGPEMSTYYTQVGYADGQICVYANSAGMVRITRSDTEIARNPTHGILHNSVDSKGAPVRVLTTPLLSETPAGPQLYPGYVLIVAYPLKDTDKTLDDLAVILLIVSGLGVVGAGAVGLAVARAGLRPVDKLTEAVEHIARTEDLTTRIPADASRQATAAPAAPAPITSTSTRSPAAPAVPAVTGSGSRREGARRAVCGEGPSRPDSWAGARR